MKKYDLSKIMKKAWEFVRKLSLTISDALKKSWKEAKGMMERKEIIKFAVKGIEKKIEKKKAFIKRKAEQLGEMKEVEEYVVDCLSEELNALTGGVVPETLSEANLYKYALDGIYYKMRKFKGIEHDALKNEYERVIKEYIRLRELEMLAHQI